MNQKDVLGVLQVCNYYYPAFEWGGPVRSMHAIGSGLTTDQSVDLAVLTTDALSPNNRQRVKFNSLPEKFKQNYRVYYCRRRYGKYGSLQLLSMLPKLSAKADVVHVTGNYTLNVFASLLYCRLRNKPTVWSPRGTLLAERDFKNNKYKRLKAMLGRAFGLVLGPRTAIHCTSSEEVGVVQARYPGVQTRCISNGVDLPEPPATEVTKTESTDTRLVFLSRLDPKKGLSELLECMRRLPERFRLDICGEGDSKYVQQLKQFVHDHRLGSRVQFLGHVEGDAKRAAYTNADMFVLPSYSENFGNVIAEAMAHGVPVVVSNRTPWQEVVERECGLWTDRDPKSFSEAILEMEKRDLIAAGQRGKRWMQEDFSWESKSLKFQELYRDLTNAD